MLCAVRLSDCTGLLARTHRTRKENYLLHLESSVVALRGQAARAEARNRVLSDEIEVLRTRLGDCGNMGDGGVGSDVGMGMIGGWEWERGGEEKRVSGSAGDVSNGTLSDASLSTSDDVLGWARGGPDQQALVGHASAVGPQSVSRSWSVSLGNADMAMDFILTYALAIGECTPLTVA